MFYSILKIMHRLICVLNEKQKNLLDNKVPSTQPKINQFTLWVLQQQSEVNGTTSWTNFQRKLNFEISMDSFSTNDWCIAL